MSVLSKVNLHRQIPILLSGIPLFVSQPYIIPKILHHGEESLVDDLLRMVDQSGNVSSRSADVFSHLMLTDLLLNAFRLNVQFDVVSEHMILLAESS